MKSRRHPQWQRRLAGRITSARELNFEWGKFDCAMWVCDWIRDVTSGALDPGAAYRGKYSTEAEAIALFTANGVADLGAFAAQIAATINLVEVGPLYASRGDIVHVDNGTAYGALGIVNLDARYAMCVSAKGVVMMHRNHWKRAWRMH
jgi:hypothetical protein